MEAQLKFDADPDPDVVEALVRGAQSGMRKASIEDVTSASEMLTAVVVFLDRTLMGIRKIQSPEERFHNAKEINRILNELLTDHGRVPS